MQRWEVSESRLRPPRAQPAWRSPRDWLALIPEYDGRPEGLEAFAASVAYVASRLGDEPQLGLLLGLGSKLRGRARAAFGHRLHRYPSARHLLDGLRSRFAGLGTEVRLLEQLRRLSQRPGESVHEFALRLDRLLGRLEAVYDSSGDDLRLVRDMALVSFRRGLACRELELRLAAYELDSLDRAIDLAVTLDNYIAARPDCAKRPPPPRLSPGSE